MTSSRKDRKITHARLVLSLVPGGIGYGPGKPKGRGTGMGLVSLLITPVPKNFVFGNLHLCNSIALIYDVEHFCFSSSYYNQEEPGNLVRGLVNTYHTVMRLNRDVLPLFHPSTLSFILLHFACKKMTSELINGEERGPKSGMGQSVLLY